MIEKIRYYSGTWWFRTFLGLVAVTFAILWGGGDWMHQMGGGKAQVVATVGSQRVSSWELRMAVERRLKQHALSTGQRMTEEDALKAGVFQQVLRTLVDDALVEQEAARLGITLTDQSVRDAIKKNPAFLDTQGAFDKKRFLMLIERLGYNEKTFLEDTRRDLMREHLLRTLFKGLRLPALESVTLYRWQDQTRQVMYAVLASDRLPFTQVPQEADLKELFTKYKEALKAPEYRDLSVLVLDPQTIGASLSVTQEELQKAYEERQASLQGKSFKDAKADLEKELRHQKALEEIYAQGSKIEDAVGSGMTLKEVSEKFHVPLVQIQKVDAAGLFNPFEEGADQKTALSDLEKAYVREGFSLEPQTAGTVVEGQDHVSFLVFVDKVQEAHYRTLAEVPAPLAKNLWVNFKKKEKAAQIAHEIASNTKNTASFLAGLSKHNVRGQKMRLTRQGPGVTSRVSLPPEVVERLFQGGVGQVAVTPLSSSLDKAEFFVGCVDAISDPDLKDRSAEIQDRAKIFNKMFENDFVSSYIFSLRKRTPVEVNQNWFKAQLKG